MSKKHNEMRLESDREQRSRSDMTPVFSCHCVDRHDTLMKAGNKLFSERKSQDKRARPSKIPFFDRLSTSTAARCFFRH